MGSDLVWAEGPGIESFGRNGELTFECPVPNQNYRVEWAPRPDGPWSSSWDELCLIEPGSAPSATVAVPMFYRVKTPAYVQVNELMSPTDAGTLIRARDGDPDFIILDVRRASERISEGKIIGSVNIDYYGETFGKVLEILPRDKVYLVHCASGNRSSNVVSTMQGLGFHTVYDLDDGFTAFKNVTTNADLIE